VGAAVEEGRALCLRDGSLARIAATIAQREEQSRRYFDERASATGGEPAAGGDELMAWLPIVAPLLPGHALAVDVGTGEGTLLPLLSALYERVIAVDRSPARLARCAAHIAARGLPNVRLREGDVEDAGLDAVIRERGGADVVVMARVLHHSARPHDAVGAAARLLRAGGHLLLVDYLPHQDETMREQGDVWLGFEPTKLRAYVEGAALELVAQLPFPSQEPLAMQLVIGRRS
jgi:ArsR family transcriptional regulator